MTSKRVCVVLSVDVDRFSDAYMRKQYEGVLRINGRLVPVSELRALCAEYRAKGYEAFPCEHADARGHCQGVEVDEHAPTEPAPPLRGRRPLDEPAVPAEVEGGPEFEPWERLMILSNAADEIPDERGGEAIRAVCGAAMTVVRQLMGKKDKAEARAAIKRALEAIEKARKV